MAVLTYNNTGIERHGAVVANGVKRICAPLRRAFARLGTAGICAACLLYTSDAADE